MLKISAVYLIGKAEIPIHYTIWALVEQALLHPKRDDKFPLCQIWTFLSVKKELLKKIQTLLTGLHSLTHLLESSLQALR